MLNREDTGRMLYDYGLSYFHRNKTKEIFLKCHASLVDSPRIYGKPKEYAPEWTFNDLVRRAKGERIETSDSKMSLARSKPIYRMAYSVFKTFKKARKKMK